MPAVPDRMPLALLPTPLQRADRLTEAWGGPTIWVKRDDLTGFGLSGNKVRKLEYHFAAARAAGADTVITCGAVQSNHCRATALAAAASGFACRLVLRSGDGSPPPTLEGNHLLDRLAGATVRFVDPDGYANRDAVMAEETNTLETGGAKVWVIPEGGSDELGMWGFVAAMAELADQLPRIPRSPVTVWHAASSGGTTAGMGWAIDRLGIDAHPVASSVGETAPEIRRRIDTIWTRAAEATGSALPGVDIEIVDRHVGGGYGIATDEELATQAEATALSGLLFDPTYTGKALHGLRLEIERGTYGKGDHVVFWHTGGGFAVFAHDFDAVLRDCAPGRDSGR